MATVEYQQLGQEAVALSLPRLAIGNQVTVGPHAQHENYLTERNKEPYDQRLADGEVCRFEGDDMKQILTIPSSGYVNGHDSIHLMLVAMNNAQTAEEQRIPTFSDFTQEQGQQHFKILGRLAEEFTKRYGNSWSIGASISPDEWHRQAVQSIKTIHTHIIGAGKELLQSVEPLSQRPAEEAKEKKRMLADSLSPLSISLLREAVFTENFWEDDTIEGIAADEDFRPGQTYPQGYTVLLNGGTEVLSNPRTSVLIQKIDTSIDEVYSYLRDAFATEEPLDILDRPTLRDAVTRKTNINAFANNHNLSSLTTVRLHRLSHIIQPAREILSRATTEERRTYLANTRLFLKGYAYNLVIFPTQEDGRLALSIVPRVLSGGSPLDAMGIYKEQYVADEKYINESMAIQRTTATEIVESAFGDIQLSEQVA